MAARRAKKSPQGIAGEGDHADYRRNIRDEADPSRRWRDLQDSQDWLDILAMYEAGEIADDRVRCLDCANMGPYACREGLGWHRTILRRCRRFSKKG